MDLLESSIPSEKKQTNADLYLRQVKMLQDFLERNAISKEQYEHSVSVLTEKMKLSQ